MLLRIKIVVAIDSYKLFFCNRWAVAIFLDAFFNEFVHFFQFIFVQGFHSVFLKIFFFFIKKKGAVERQMIAAYVSQSLEILDEYSGGMEK